MYLNSVQIIGFIGKDPERRQARSNGAAFTVLSVATQRSWKNADDEWASRTDHCERRGTAASARAGGIIQRDSQAALGGHVRGCV